MTGQGSNFYQTDNHEFIFMGNKGLNLPFKSASWTLMQGVWEADHLKPCCISLLLSNEKNLTLLRPAAGTRGGDAPSETDTGREAFLCHTPPLPKITSPRIHLALCPTGRSVAWAQKHGSAVSELLFYTHRMLHRRGHFYVMLDLQHWGF